MLLSEKEMAKILTETLEAAVVSLATVPTARILNIGHAAHAIAERMREGVIWEGEAMVRHEWRSEDVGLVLGSTLHFQKLPAGWLRSIPDCQRVRVYVVKDEDDQPEP